MTPTAAAPSAVQVRSSSRPGVLYEVTRDSCGCESFVYGRRRDPGFQCKHILAVFPTPADAPFYCVRCGQVRVYGHDLVCAACLGAWAASLPVPVDLQDAKTVLPFPTPICPVCGEQPAQAGSELCAGCVAVQVADAAAYAPDAPVMASPIYAETMRDVTRGPAINRNQARGMRLLAPLTDAAARCEDCGQTVPGGARTSFPLCPACRSARLITGRAHTDAVLAVGGNPFA